MSFSLDKLIKLQELKIKVFSNAQGGYFKFEVKHHSEEATMNKRRKYESDE